MINLIGISGKIGSGKDTVGRIIQWLTCPKVEEDLGIILKSDEYWTTSSDWQIKKFAGKLKQIVSILTGIPVEDLEKQEVKDKVLGEEWIRYGYANGFTQSNGNTIMNNEACSKEKYEEEYRTNWQTAYKTHYKVRDLLQLIGTEAMRNVIHRDVWVNALFADYKLGKIIGEANITHIQNRDGEVRELAEPVPQHVVNGNYPNWIITDLRFQNEAEAITSRDGVLLRINRAVETGKHSSETALDNYAFHYYIDNNGSIEELIEKTKTFLKKFNIIKE